MHCAQMSHFHPPQPYSTHIPSAEPALDLSLSVSIRIRPFHSSAHASKLFPPPHLTAAALERPSPPISNPNPDENDFLETSSMSDEVDLQYILPHPSLGLDERQRIFGQRLCKLVLLFVCCLRIIKSFLAGRSRDFKWASHSARSYSFKFTSHLRDRISEHGGVSELDVSMSSYDR